MLRAFILFSLLLLGWSCKSDESTPDLRATVEDAWAALESGDAKGLYDHFTNEFRRSCSTEEFETIMTTAQSSIAGLDLERLTITHIEMQGEDAATVEPRLGPDGELIVLTADRLLEYWRLEDGEWKTRVGRDVPCG